MIDDVLTWPGWAGVQGVAAILGLGAITVAVTDFVLRLNDTGFEAPSFGWKSTRGFGDYEEITVTVRAAGSRPLFEPQWVVWGHDTWTRPELPGTLRPGDAAHEMRMRIRIGEGAL